MIKIKDILLGVRVSKKIKKSMDLYCRKNGISRKHFVQEAIHEKLLEVMEEADDVSLAEERMKNLELVNEAQIEQYFKKRIKG